MMRELLRTILLPTLVLLLASMGSVVGDPTSLLVNGDFEWENFGYAENVGVEVAANGLRDLIPMWKVLHGGVQVYDGNQYHEVMYGDLPIIYSNYLLHMNSKYGPGVMVTSMLTTPRKGAPYTVQFLMSDHPDGGPLVKALRVKTLINDRVAPPRPRPFSVSNPYCTRTSLEWQTMTYTMVGTGEMTKLQFESLTRGGWGPIIDNITVTLQSLLDNGSFENSSCSGDISNLTKVVVLEPPSSDIFGWTVTSGKIRYSNNFRFQPCSDLTPIFVELNADFAAGAITSDPFATTPGKKYRVLFDTAASPLAPLPSLTGTILASVHSHPGGALLAARQVVVSTEGFSLTTVGWMTYEFEFRASSEGWTCLQFESQIVDSNSGPLLDNVAIYQVMKPARYKKVKPTFTGQTVGGSATSLTPSLWSNSLTLGLALCVLRALVI